jgi:hypothetical protein
MRNLSLASQWESHARGHGKKKKIENEQTGTGNWGETIFQYSTPHKEDRSPQSNRQANEWGKARDTKRGYSGREEDK